MTTRVDREEALRLLQEEDFLALGRRADRLRETLHPEGRVTYVSPVAEFTPRNVQTPDERAKLVYRVKIAVPNPDGALKPGMPAEGFLRKPE